ncbi:MAG: DUF309 domain-containing protein [Candidatus Hydrogenedentes bacterium]|nr:DUF309 domain-containing protein [Candidatus Hydrogenedentota bacterium]
MSVDTVLQEPAPVWPDAPRLCPSRSFPAYRYVSGLNPHPARGSGGLDWGGLAFSGSLPTERWRENEAYLYGIDLYHQGYLWESHEVWESLWRLLPRPDPQARLLQGLIRNSAAQIKAHAGSLRGVRAHSTHACELLNSLRSSETLDGDGQFMGLSITKLLSQMERHYGAVWRQEPAEVLVLEGPPPRLEPRP